MEGAQGCPICKKVSESESCSCRGSLSRFFSLLQEVDSRCVSTQKAQSGHPQGRACIDKLVFALPSFIGVGELRERFQQKGIRHVQIKLRDRRWYLQVGEKDQGIFVYLGHHEAEWTSKVITRPSAFSSFSSYLTTLDRLFGSNLLTNAKIARCDFAVDYDAPLVNVLRGLDIRNKQVVTQFTDRGAVRTGMMIGKGSEKIVVYDKAKDIGQKEPLTRIEVQLSGKKVQTTTLNDLREQSLKALTVTPFDSITLHNVDLTEAITVPRDQDKDRLSELEVILSREGLLSARKSLNGNGNFQRDYGSLMTLRPWHQQPTDILTRYLRDYFSDTVKKEENNHAYH